MRKEEWGMASVGLLLLSLAFPPYFIAFLSASALGGLAYLLKSLSEEERQELTEFEKEFRKGYLLEQEKRFREAELIYLDLAEKYPKFAYIALERIRYLRRDPEMVSRTENNSATDANQPPLRLVK